MATPTTIRPLDFPSAEETTVYRAMLDAIVDGTTPDPPYVRRLALPRPTEWSYGRISGLVDISEELTWNSGAVFGGYVSCITDVFAGLVMLSVLPDRAGFLTGHIDLTFRSPLLPGQAYVEATVTALTAQKATTEVLIRQSGRVTSTARLTQIILSKWKDRDDPAASKLRRPDSRRVRRSPRP
jgi:acyl-coenzyme A thioesterase PaaI-like protein